MRKRKLGERENLDPPFAQGAEWGTLENSEGKSQRVYRFGEWRLEREGGSWAAALQNVPKWERANRGRKAQDVVVECRSDYQRQKKVVSPGRTDRRKTGVNTGDFG